MSYFKREGTDSRYVTDRLPIYVFPAFVGSGRILLGMALAGVTTGVLLHLGTIRQPLYWWLALLAYIASLILVVSGVYAINVIPPRRPVLAPLYEPREAAPPPTPLAVEVEQPIPVSPAPPAPEPSESRLGYLLVQGWHLVTEERLAEARADQASTGRSLVHVLAHRGWLTDVDLERILGLVAAESDPWHDTPRDV